jgi:MmyB-like transcription regulator ligand binding domain
MADWPARQRNTIRYTFLHPGARDLWPDWETKAKAKACVGHPRTVAGADPDDPDLAAMVGELAVKSPDFSRLRERYDVPDHDAMTLLDMKGAELLASSPTHAAFSCAATAPSASPEQTGTGPVAAL